MSGQVAGLVGSSALKVACWVVIFKFFARHSTDVLTLQSMDICDASNALQTGPSECCLEVTAKWRCDERYCEREHKIYVQRWSENGKSRLSAVVVEEWLDDLRNFDGRGFIYTIKSSLVVEESGRKRVPRTAYITVLMEAGGSKNQCINALTSNARFSGTLLGAQVKKILFHRCYAVYQIKFFVVTDAMQDPIRLCVVIPCRSICHAPHIQSTKNE